MTELDEIYKCAICGNVVDVVHKGAGELVCCGQPMEVFQEKTQDEGNEKHKPLIEVQGDHSIVKVGSVPHPMEAEHYIEWIEGTTVDGIILRSFLKPGVEPIVKFPVVIVKARAYCNVHGLWTSD